VSSGSLTRANFGAIVLFGSYVASQFLITQYLQILLAQRPGNRRVADEEQGLESGILETISG
jgi:hypothetical protein